MKSKLNWTAVTGFVGVTLAAGVQAQPTAFTYQGQLTVDGQPASGIYDIRFAIYDADSGGSVLAGPLTNSPVTVSNGLFTLAMDFGPDVFDGANRWFDFAVRTNGSTGGFAALSPRQLVTSTPYAVRARSVDGANITGIVPNNALPANLVRTDPGLVEMEADFIFKGAVEFQNPSGPPFVVTGSPDMVPGLNAEMLGNRTAQGFWQTQGNSGTTEGTDFIGTTDNQPLELKANGQRALRLEPTPDPRDAPNLVGGHPVNSVNPGVIGATISGGGTSDYQHLGLYYYPNRVTGDYGTIGGGAGNTCYDTSVVGGGYANAAESPICVVGGGLGNHAKGDISTIGGGQSNAAEGQQSTIAGGTQNRAGGEFSAIGGGLFNEIGTNAPFSIIGGGCTNTIGAGSHGSTIGGGDNNTITASKATIGGGVMNKIQAAYGAVIGGGGLNEITTYAEYAVIPGGYQNRARGYFSLAAGLRAKADHDGAFVWADYTDADFSSSRANEFAIRANGGVRIDSGSGPGINLNAADRPLVTRGHDPFTSGDYLGAGRWGLFMEPHTLIAGIPAIAGKTFRVSTYNADSSLNKHLMTVDQAGTVTATAFNPTSDRNAKENFTQVNPSEVLEKVTAMPISRWNFKQDESAAHIGPMAQDFRAAFGLGKDDKHIATVDADGVALAAIQGLNEKVEGKIQNAEKNLQRSERIIQQLKTENAEIKRELQELKQLITTLAEKGDNE